jgi:predicted site-specific integrase-resolvase
MSQVERCYTINHAARIADQSRATIKRRIKDGLIKVNELADGSKRIRESELVHYLGYDLRDNERNGGGQ